MNSIDEVGEGADPKDSVVIALSSMAATTAVADAERLSSIEQRIRASMHDAPDVSLSPDGVPAEVGAEPRRRGMRPLLAAAAVVLAVAVGSLALLLAGDDDVLAIDAADRVVVELPDGAPFAGAAGTELPDGTSLEVIGFVEVDGERFGPGRYRVVDGKVVSIEPAARDAHGGPDPVGDRTAPSTDRSPADDLVTATTEPDVVSATTPRRSAEQPAVDDPALDQRPAPIPRPAPAPTPTAPPERPPPTVAPRPPGTRAPTRPPTTQVTRPETTTTAPARTTTTTAPARTTTTTAPARTTTMTSTTETTVPLRTTVPDQRGEHGRGAQGG